MFVSFVGMAIVTLVVTTFHVYSKIHTIVQTIKAMDDQRNKEQRIKDQRIKEQSKIKHPKEHCLNNITTDSSSMVKKETNLSHTRTDTPRRRSFGHLDGYKSLNCSSMIKKETNLSPARTDIPRRRSLVYSDGYKSLNVCIRHTQIK